MLTVRPTTPCERIRAATRSDSRSSSRRTTRGSSTSRAKVSSAPTLFSTCSGTTGRGSRPHDSSCRWVPTASPTALRRVSTGTCARSATVRSPSRWSDSSVFSPTPHSAPTGSRCRKVTVSSRGTTSSPSGLARPEASLATNFVAATPTEQVIRCSSATRSRSSRAISAGGPSRRTAPATSRKASSRLSGSTAGVTDRKISMTPRETSAYRSCRGSRTTARGHSRRARPIGIAEWTPYRRASYVADRTTLRPLPPPTTTGRPCRSGRSTSSTEA